MFKRKILTFHKKFTLKLIHLFKIIRCQVEKWLLYRKKFSSNYFEFQKRDLTCTMYLCIFQNLKQKHNVQILSCVVSIHYMCMYNNYIIFYIKLYTCTHIYIYTCIHTKVYLHKHIKLCNTHILSALDRKKSNKIILSSNSDLVLYLKVVCLVKDYKQLY